MSEKQIDVLRVMDHSMAACGAYDCDDCTKLREAAAAVGELIEAADVLTDAITFRIDDPRHALLDRVVKALARVRSS